MELGPVQVEQLKMVAEKLQEIADRLGPILELPAEQGDPLGSVPADLEYAAKEILNALGRGPNSEPLTMIELPHECRQEECVHLDKCVYSYDIRPEFEPNLFWPDLRLEIDSNGASIVCHSHKEE